MYPGGMMIDEQEEAAVLEVLRTKRLFRYYGPVEGPSKADELESAFARHMGVRHAVAVTSGTAALVSGLMGIGIGPGDEVIVPAYTWIASPLAVAAVGAVPVVAEVDETLTLDPEDVRRKLSPYTKAIMPVHMRGWPARMDALIDIARTHGLRVVEDTAQADGASFRGQRLGSIGDVGCFSLQFNKIITCGEGGMVITDSEGVWKRVVMYGDVAAGSRHNMPREEILGGVNYRISELQAAVALVQLGRLEDLLLRMRERKRLLRAGVEETARRNNVLLQPVTDPEGDASIAFVLFAQSPGSASEIAEALRAENISAGVIYTPGRMDYHVYADWVPIMARRTWTPEGGPWRWARRDVQYSVDMCPRTLDLLGRAIHMDVNPLLTNQDIEETIEGVNRVIEALA
jgi:dTDP-4-amino-4,6-dideoxygalactose transaminase